jgi:hypothetical protein
MFSLDVRPRPSFFERPLRAGEEQERVARDEQIARVSPAGRGRLLSCPLISADTCTRTHTRAYTRAHEAAADLRPRLSSFSLFLSTAKKMQMHAPKFWKVTRNARGRGEVFLFQTFVQGLRHCGGMLFKSRHSRKHEEIIEI